MSRPSDPAYTSAAVRSSELDPKTRSTGVLPNQVLVRSVTYIGRRLDSNFYGISKAMNVASNAKPGISPRRNLAMCKLQWQSLDR